MSDSTSTNCSPATDASAVDGKIGFITCTRCFFFQAEDGIRDLTVTGVQTCALPICSSRLGDLTSPVTRVTTRRRVEPHVVQYLRSPFQGHDLRRKPRSCDRLCGRWLPAAHAADRGRHPALSRQKTAGPVALHPAAA